MLTVFGFYFFGVNVFQAGYERTDLQQNVRIAADFINRELRQAVEVQLISSGEITYKLPETKTCYTIKQKNNEIIFIINATETKIAYNIGNLFFDQDSDKGILNFIVEGCFGNHNYTVSTAVRLHNLKEE